MMNLYIIEVINIIMMFYFLDNYFSPKEIKNRKIYLIIIFYNILLLSIKYRIIINLYNRNTFMFILIYYILIIICLILFRMEEKSSCKMNLDYEINYEEIIDMYTQMLGWNHDFNNHINMILGLLEVGTKEDAISYINELNSNIQKLGKNIYTDDLVINSILITNIKAAEEKNIKINLDLKIDSPKRISDVDTCIILGNLLDNSIEACSYIKGDKFIDLKIVSQNDRLIFKISNNTNGNIKEVNGSFLSTKKKNMYGIGLTQIDSTVKKLNGYVNRKHKNNLFTTYIMIEY